MNKTDVPENDHHPGKSTFLAVAIPLAMLTAVTLLAFVNAWPDSLVFDDKAFVGPARPHELDSLYNIFTRDLWANVGAPGYLYRPLLLLGLTLETWVFGDWLAGYHLSNIFQHLLVTFLVYGFFRHLLRMTGNQSASSDLYALLAAMAFAVHPIHTEAIDSVFNRSEIMVALFGLAGLWWLFHYLDLRPGRAWFGLGITYFLGLLSKESAVVIPGLAVALIFLLTTGDLITRIRKCLPVFWMFIPLTIYLAMRAHALALPELGLETVSLVDSSNFLKVAGVLGESMKVIAWPYPLHLYYSRLSTPMMAGYLALHLVLIITALVQLKRKRFSLAAGLAFFYIAMLPASRIINTTESTAPLAERYLYFPSVGLAILLAFALRALAQRFTPRVVAGCGMPVLVILTALTWDRNADWVSDVSLFETEYLLGSRHFDTLRLLTSAQLEAGNQARVVKICDENLERQEKYARSTFVYYCAVAYEHQHRNEEAERAYLFQIEDTHTRIGASMALAHFYIRQERPQDATTHYADVIDWSDDPADKALYQAEMIISLNPKNRGQGIIARGYLEEAIRLRPGWPKAESMLKAVDNALKASSNREIDGKDSH